MNDIIGQAPKIIAESAKSPLGIVALMTLALSFLGYLFFGSSSEGVKVGMFCLMFAGLAYNLVSQSSTGPWSRFVVDPDARGIGTVRYPRVEARDDDCANKLAKRTLTNLYNERPAWLANAHAKLDPAVAAAYGFNVDLADEQILERLLSLNQKRAAAEKKASTTPKKRISRTRSVEEML